MRIWSRLPTIMAILSLVGLAYWGFADYRKAASDRITYAAELQDGGTFLWSMIEPAAIIWSQPLDLHAKVRSKVLTIGADGGGEALIGVMAQSSNVRTWAVQHDVSLAGLFGNLQLRVPSVSITADDEMFAQVSMSTFAVNTAIYMKSTGGVLVFTPPSESSQIIDPARSPLRDVDILGPTNTQFGLGFERGFHTPTRSVSESTTGPSGVFGTPAGPQLTLTVGAEQPGYAFSLLEPRGARIYVIPGKTEVETNERGELSFKTIKGGIDVYTRVRIAAAGLNPGQLSIVGEGDRPIDRTEYLYIEFAEKKGGELQFNSQDGKAEITGIARSVMINGHQQLGRQLDKWQWYKQYLLLALVLPWLVQRVKGKSTSAKATSTSSERLR